jgi:hypothetical protein
MQKTFYCGVNLMTQYKVFDEAIILTVKTKRPEKWLLIDRETGQVYQGNPKGYWDRLEPYVKESE